MTTTVQPARPHRRAFVPGTVPRGQSASSWVAGTVATLVLASAGLVAAAAPADATDWVGAVDLSAAGQNAVDPRIAVSGDGQRATAVWTRFDGTHDIVQARTSPDGGVTWGAGVDLSATGRNAAAPQLAISGNGSRVTAVWTRFDGSDEIVQARSSSDGGATWGAVVSLSLTGQSAYEPQVAASTDGTRVTVVWRRSDGAHFVVQSRTSTDGGATWGSVKNLSASGQNASGPQVAASASGSRVTAVWQRFDGADVIVQARSSSDGGATWGGVRNLSAPGQGAQDPQVAVSADGARVVSSWSRSDGTHLIVQVRTSADGGSTWGAAFDLSTPGQNATAPQMAVSVESARITLVWQRFDGANSIVAIRTSIDAGITWGPVADLSVPGQNATAPQVVTSADGMTVVSAWYRPDGATLIAQARSSTDGGTTWGPVSDLSAPGQDADGVRVDAAADGSRVIAVWSRSNGTTTTVQAAAGVAPAPAPLPSAPAVGDAGTVPLADGSATVAALTAQRPLRALGLPATVRRIGTTRLVRLPVTTNAGQRARVRVTCAIRPARGTASVVRPRDPVRACRVIRTAAAVKVRVSGTRTVRVAVRVYAAAVPGFTAYRSRTAYRVRAVR